MDRVWRPSRRPGRARCAWPAGARRSRGDTRGELMIDAACSRDHSRSIGPVPAEVALDAGADPCEHRAEVAAAHLDAKVADEPRLALGHRDEADAEPGGEPIVLAVADPTGRPDRVLDPRELQLEADDQPRRRGEHRDG